MNADEFWQKLPRSFPEDSLKYQKELIAALWARDWQYQHLLNSITVRVPRNFRPKLKQWTGRLSFLCQLFKCLKDFPIFLNAFRKRCHFQPLRAALIFIDIWHCSIPFLALFLNRYLNRLPFFTVIEHFSCRTKFLLPAGSGSFVEPSPQSIIAFNSLNLMNLFDANFQDIIHQKKKENENFYFPRKFSILQRNGKFYLITRKLSERLRGVKVLEWNLLMAPGGRENLSISLFRKLRHF